MRHEAGATPEQSRARAVAWVAGILVLACAVWIFAGQGGADREPGQGGPGVGGDQAAPAVWVRERIGPGEPRDAIGERRANEAAEGLGVGGSAATAAEVLVAVGRRGEAAPASARAPVATEALHAQVQRDAATVHRETAGQRLRLQGQLSAVEQGEPGVAVLHLALAGQAETVRVVAAPSLAATALGWSVPRAVSLDCLSQGVMMGEWLLVDCRE